MSWKAEEIEGMRDQKTGMIEKHARTGKPHDGFYTIPVFPLITMNSAF
jgi:hypothetical protein